ncbi:MAG: LysM peptidoglycan-binding domain-containing protein [Desulfovibrionales bacterium]|nr:LysM peptidoglycan-binding domain-containing protein [Desulfovibrionales bacterium]
MKRVSTRFLILFCALSLIAASPVGAETHGYTVQPGDTLWDITSRFFHDPWLWPNLWKNNPHITNPHLVFPGCRLRLSVEKEAPKQEFESSVPPPSIPHIETISAEPPEKPTVKTVTYLGMNTLGFISKEKLEEKGTIRDMPLFKELLNQGDVVYLTNDGDLLQKGSIWTVYRAPDMVYRPLTRERIGYYYLPLGKLEIIKAGNPATGQIISSHQAISIDDQIMPSEEMPTHIPLKCPSGPIAATIIKSEPLAERIAQDHIVYLDKGKKDGLEAGVCLEVFKTKEVAGTQQILSLGNILVLQTQEETSAALVIRSKEPFSIGEKVRTENP